MGRANGPFPQSTVIATSDSRPVQPHEAVSPTPSGAGQEWERGPGPLHLCTLGPPSLFRPPPCLDRTAWGPRHFPFVNVALPPPSAGYQGSFHSIQNCFPYGDCYRVTEPAAGGDGLAGEAHGFNPLRPNGYHSLSAPLPATGKPHLRDSLP